jgi:hypothetical protein
VESRSPSSFHSFSNDDQSTLFDRTYVSMNNGLNESACGRTRDSPCKSVIYACQQQIDVFPYPKTVVVMPGIYIEEVPFIVAGVLIVVGVSFLYFPFFLFFFLH